MVACLKSKDSLKIIPWRVYDIVQKLGYGLVSKQNILRGLSLNLADIKESTEINLATNSKLWARAYQESQYALKHAMSISMMGEHERVIGQFLKMKYLWHCEQTQKSQ